MKNNYLKTLLAISLAATMVLGTAACGQKEQEGDTSEVSKTEESKTEEAKTEESESEELSLFNTEGYPIVNEEYTIKIFQHINDWNNLKEPDEITAVQMLEELTGINIEWEQVRDADWSTKLSIMFASGEIPDIILKGNLGGFSMESYGVDQKLIIPLDELIDQYMPNYKERIALEELDPTSGLKASDGQTYCLGYLIGGNALTGNQFFINQKWLDALNLEMPETPQELTEVLRAFKEGDPNGNGEADEIPIVSTNSYLFLSLFGVPGNGNNWMHIDDNKQVKFIGTTDEFRDCVEWMHELYTEELLDPEIFSQDDNTVYFKLQNGQGGMFMNYRLKNAQFINVAEEYVLWTPTGDAQFPRTLSTAAPAAYITSACEHPEIAARLFDAMIEDEIGYSAYIGAQGDPYIGWDYNEEGKIEMYEYMDQEGYNDYMSQPWNFMNTNWNHFWPETYYAEHFGMTEDYLDKKSYTDSYREAGIIEKYSVDYLGQANFNAEEKEQINLILTDINTCIVENWVEFIRGGVTDEKWNAYVKRFDSLKVEELLQMYQDKIDAMDIQ